jgi:2-polyprenyl-3-methyl-5-hydroxy-6-metoxy-1,4-benzoquinol methylase
MKEAVLEPLLRWMRIRRVLPIIRSHSNCYLLDVGCGWDAALLRSVEPFITKGVGIDFKAPRILSEKITTQQMMLGGALPVESESFDIVTLLAVLEHLEQPRQIVIEIHRVLKPGGRTVITVPSKASKFVLEFLAYRLRVVSEAEIRDHKQYYDRRDLVDLFSSTGFHIERHEYFQLGMNNFFVARKPAEPSIP